MHQDKEMVKNKSKDLDQFYTHPDYAYKFLDIVKKKTNYKNYDIVLEPSAGTGSFYNLLDNRRIGLDLDPKCKGVIKTNFFDYDWTELKNKKILTIGNPPFGKNASLANKFFNHSARFSDTIAFLLPRTFRKASMINRLDNSFHLIHDETVPDNSFIFENKSYDVWCTAQIWQRKNKKREKIKIYSLTDADAFFKIVDPLKADFAIQRVGGRAGLIRKKDFNTYSPLSHYFIKSKHPKTLDIFESCDFELVKYDTAGNPSVSPNELVQLFFQNAKKFNLELNNFNKLFK